MTTKERPILFSAPMVRAILDGRKTVTRRIVKFRDPSQTYSVIDDEGDGEWPYNADDAGQWHKASCPYGQPGDRLWVRETWGLFDTMPSDGPDRAHVFYRATDGNRHDLRFQLWRPSIFMPRWASRISLEVTGVRVERLQDITDPDLWSEGIRVPVSQDGSLLAILSGKFLPADYWPCETFSELRKRPDFLYQWSLSHFAAKWDELNGAGSWAANPWVWVVSFKHLTDSR